MEGNAFLKLHEDGLRVDEHHPMSVLDVDFSKVLPMSTSFRAPACVTTNSVGHIVRQSLPQSLDPVDGISTYLLPCEKGTHTNFHQDCSGTAVFYLILEGIKIFFLVRWTLHNLRLFRAWLKSVKTE